MIPLSKPDITEKEIKAVIDVLKSWWLALWPKLKEFEKLAAKIANTKFASAVNSWTSWLHLIVKSLWIWKNNAVFVPSFTFIASVNCFIYEWATPIFTDIEEDTYNISVEWIENYIKNNCDFDWKKLIDKKSWKHIKAIVWVHIFWHPFDVDWILKLCKKYNLYLIEDAAEAIWSEYKNKPVWQFWEASIFAFYPNKQITTWEWWVITTNNEKYYKLYESLKNQWRLDDTQWLIHDKLWYNYRMSDINAAIWIEQLKRLDEIIKKRNKVAALYDKEFNKYKDMIKTPTVKNYCTKYSRFAYVIEIKKDINIQNIIKYLKDKWIQTKNYFYPIHLQKFYIENYNTKNLDLPITNKAYKRTLALPFYNSLKEEEIKYIVKEVINSLQDK